MRIEGAINSVEQSSLADVDTGVEARIEIPLKSLPPAKNLFYTTAAFFGESTAQIIFG